MHLYKCFVIIIAYIKYNNISVQKYQVFMNNIFKLKVLFFVKYFIFLCKDLQDSK